MADVNDVLSARPAPFDMECARCGKRIKAGEPVSRFKGAWICAGHMAENVIRE